MDINTVACGFNTRCDFLINAMATDAINNEDKYESSKVRMMDVSDCPDLKVKLRDYFNECDDTFEDLAYELLMEDMNQFRMKNDLAAA
jgi:hypothetical protein